MEQINVIILAGGKSSRMGEDKGLMTLFGKPMIGYVIDRARELTSDILIVSNNEDYQRFGLQVVKDEIPDKGPLGGIYSGLKASKSTMNIILSCDVPYIKTGLLKYLLYQSEGYDVTVPIHEERIHPLIGIYSKNILPSIERNIITGKLKVTDAFKGLKLNVVEANEFDEIEFKNLNSKQDIIPPQ
jgi:molybdopterin-guanine dinucleotide biosynthesis protein A